MHSPYLFSTGIHHTCSPQARHSPHVFSPGIRHTCSSKAFSTRVLPRHSPYVLSPGIHYTCSSKAFTLRVPSGIHRTCSPQALSSVRILTTVVSYFRTALRSCGDWPSSWRRTTCPPTSCHASLTTAASTACVPTP